MPRPRIFISSTHADLRIVREQLQELIQSLHYEAVLSENGNIVYQPDRRPGMSAVAEVASCDMLILVIGTRSGSDSTSGAAPASDFYTIRPPSFTRREWEMATDKHLPVYVLIESHVAHDYQTFRLNRNNTEITYAYVDSVNVLHFIDTVYEAKKNNPIKEFERFEEIEHWLREQWAAQFRDQLKRLCRGPVTTHMRSSHPLMDVIAEIRGGDRVNPRIYAVSEQGRQLYGYDPAAAASVPVGRSAQEVIDRLEPWIDPPAVYWEDLMRDQAEVYRRFREGEQSFAAVPIRLNPKHPFMPNRIFIPLIVGAYELEDEGTPAEVTRVLYLDPSKLPKFLYFVQLWEELRAGVDVAALERELDRIRTRHDLRELKPLQQVVGEGETRRQALDAAYLALLKASLGEVITALHPHLEWITQAAADQPALAAFVGDVTAGESTAPVPPRTGVGLDVARLTRELEEVISAEGTRLEGERRKARQEEHRQAALERSIEALKAGNGAAALKACVEVGLYWLKQLTLREVSTPTLSGLLDRTLGEERRGGTPGRDVVARP